MLNVSNAFNEAFKSDLREVKMRVTINDVTYTDEDIISFNYNSSSIVGDTYAIGSTFANSIKLTLCKIVEGLKQLDVVKPEMGIVLPDGSTEFVKLGTFLISEEVNPDRNENRTSLECTDKMLMLDDTYESKLSYPATIRAVALEIANLAGVEVDKVSFSRLRQEQIRKPEGYTYRQAIGLIAQFEAGYATFDRNGLLTIKQLTDKNFEVTPNEYFLKGLVKNELIFRPSGIQVKTGENEADVLEIGSKKGSVIKLENKVMEANLLKTIYENVKSINYYPYTLNWRGNPAVEAGDWLYVTDTKGNKFKVPNLSYTLEYKGGLTAKSSVETVASNEVKFGYKSVLDQTIEYVNDALLNADGNVVSYGVDEPPNPKEGDVWFKKVGPDTQIWVYERIGDTDKFEWVLKVDTAGNTEAFEKTKDIEKELEKSKQEISFVRKRAEEGIEKANQSIKEVTDETQKELARVQEDAAKALTTGNDLLNNIDSLKETVNKQGIDIEKTDNSLKAQVAKLDINSTQLASLKLESDRLSSTVSETVGFVNNFKVGGANLFTNTDDYKGYVFASDTGNSEDYKINGQELVITPTNSGNFYFTPSFLSNISLEKDVEYVVSFLMKADNKNNIKLYWYPSEKYTNWEFNLDDKWTKYIFKYKQVADTVVNPVKDIKHLFGFHQLSENTTYSFKHLKLEKGNIATDWTLSSEDIVNQSDIEKVETSLKQTKDLIQLKADKTSLNTLKQTVDKNTNEIKIANDKINLKAEKSEINILDKTIKQQASELTVQSDMIKAQASKVDGNSTQLANLKLESDRLSSTVSQTVSLVNGLDVQNTNLLQSTINFELYSNNYKESPIEFDKKEMRVRYLKGDKLTTFSNLITNVDESVEFVTEQYTLKSEVSCSVFLGGDVRTSVKLEPNIWKVVSITYKSKTQNRFTGIYSNDLPANKWLYIKNLKSEKGMVATDWTPAPEDLATQQELSTVVQTVDSLTTVVQGKAEKSQIVQLSNQISAVVSDNKENSSSINILQGAIQSTVKKGDVISSINQSPEKITLDAKRIHITGETTIDNAAIRSAAIRDLSADKINTGTLDARKVRVVGIDAGNIVAKNLSSITTETGNLNVSGWMNVTSTFGGIAGVYNYTETEAYRPRSFTGTYALSNQTLSFKGHASSSNGGQNRSFESYFGLDYFKLRKYTQGTSGLIGRVDITSEMIELRNTFNDADNQNGIRLYSSGDAYFNGITRVYGQLMAGNIDADNQRTQLSINYERDLGRMLFGKDPTGRFVLSDTIYNRTYNSQAQVCITDAGTLGRVVSARKYKKNIRIASDLISKAENVLSLQPKSWNSKQPEDKQVHYGFIADDFHDCGLTEVVLYKDGEIEGLSYDRISMYHNVILTKHEQEIIELKQRIKELEHDIKGKKL